MITKSGIEIPDSMLVGVQRANWPMNFFYEDQEAAAKWIAGNPQDRHVFRISFTPVEELRYVPPVPASLQPTPVEILKVGNG